MKTSSLASFLLASSLALGLAPAFAQPGAMSGPGPMADGPGMRAGWHGHGGRGGMMRQLNLSEAQRDQIFQIHHQQVPAFRDQMKKVRAAREELRQLALADRYDEAAVRRAADAQARAMADLAVMRAQAAHRVREVLTPEQRAKMDRLHQQRWPGHGPRG